MKPITQSAIEYQVVPVEGGSFAVLDENNHPIFCDTELRNQREATDFAKEHARRRGISVNVAYPVTGQPGSSDLAMVYSAETLKVIEAFRERIGRLVREAALESARVSGRRLVTEDDAWNVVEQIEDHLKPVLPGLAADET